MSSILVENITREPWNVSLWCRYLNERKQLSFLKRRAIYERALVHLPGSYKLWSAYLHEGKLYTRNHSTMIPSIIEIFERCIMYMHKMPKIWTEYIMFLRTHHFITKCRLTCDKALSALPLTQHHLIWPQYIDFVEEHSDICQLGLTVFPRYLEFNAEAEERYLDYLVKAGQHAIAMERIASELLKSNRSGKVARDQWIKLCEMICKYAKDAVASPVLQPDTLFQTAIERLKDDTSRLWCYYADYNIRLGRFDRAQDIYEDAIHAVQTVRDFSTIFDAYSQFQEEMLTAKVDLFNDEETADDSFYFVHFEAEDKINDVDLRLAQMEHLMEQRQLLLNAVKLRQNPNNIDEWHHRAQLFKEREDWYNVVMTYKDALDKVDHAKAHGENAVFTLYKQLARVYEDNEDVDQARQVFEQGYNQLQKLPEDQAELYCMQAEMEIRIDNAPNALAIIRQGATRGQRSLKLWGLYADLEESIGTLDTARAVYNRMIDYKLASPHNILNYANMLEENKFFEESFKVYERGLALFDWPHSQDIWLNYLSKFIHRYKQEKIARARDLFEQALESCPNDLCKPLYSLLATYEEEFGDPRRAMTALDSMCARVSQEDKVQMYMVYAAKAQELFGMKAVREVFEKAIENLTDPSNVRLVSLRYAEKEQKLGEIDRARAIYRHGAQCADPRTVVSYWKHWNDFEVAFGNEETFREMLRVKRTIASQYQHTNYHLASDAQDEATDPPAKRVKTLES